METKTFNVTCTLIYNGNFDIEASSEEEALDIMNDQLAEIDLPARLDGFEFGEVTADYADEV